MAELYQVVQIGPGGSDVSQQVVGCGVEVEKGSRPDELQTRQIKLFSVWL